VTPLLRGTLYALAPSLLFWWLLSMLIRWAFFW